MTSASGLSSRLAANHLADLRASGLTEETIAAAGLYTERDAKVVQQLLNWDWSADKIGACLMFPFADASGQVNGYQRAKPSRPRIKDNKPVKYESPLKSSPRAYFPPETIPVLFDQSVPLLLTEGEKKSLKADQESFPCVGLTGVNCWHKKRPKGPDGKGSGPYELIEDLAAVPWQDRTVYIVFDSDAATNDNVLWAEWHLGCTLARHGAKVLIVRLPPKSDGTKNGLDDYLVEHGPAALLKLMAAATPPVRPPSVPGLFKPDDAPVEFTNFFTRERTNDQGKPEAVKVGYSSGAIAKRLIALTGGWPKRVGRQLFASADNAVGHLDTPTDLFAWIGRQLPDGDGNALRWVGQGEDKVSRQEFHAHLQQTVENFEAVESYPHFPALPRHYYLHPKLEGGDGSALGRLLERFNPATTIDCDLVKGYFLSLASGLSPGRRPAWLFTADESDDRQGRGVGKTALAEVGAELFGGSISIDTGREDMPAIKQRLLSPEAQGKRVVLLDNIKSLKLSWDGLESLITIETISGKRMYVGEGRMPNTFTVCLTLNGATLSKDMAQRVIIVHLRRPSYSPTWREQTSELIRSQRWAIIGDLVAILSKPAPPLARYSRWAEWERMVLARLPGPADIQAVIEERQAAVDDDQEDVELLRNAFAHELRQGGHNPDSENVFIRTADAAEIVNRVTGEKRAVNKAAAYLKAVGVTELRRSKLNNERGWCWSGANSGSKPMAMMQKVPP